MKRLKLLFVAIILASGAQAQIYMMDYTPEVVVVGMRERDGEQRAISQTIKHYLESHVSGFQQSNLPQFIMSGRSNRFMLGIGGFVNFRTAYDFEGIVENQDFVTYNIPIPGTPATKQRILMDASTTRLFFKAIANTKSLGRIVSYIETDFRGGENGYQLRLRLAYISFKGFLFGRNVTTFCDLTASPTTIDFQGPNAYTFGYNTMIRYTHSFGKHWQIGAALEMPQISSTTGLGFENLPQRLPDVPVYVQYNWGKGGSSHVRASGIFRDMYYYSNVESKNRSDFGWGAQISAAVNFSRKLSMTGQALYGKGITPYLQDLQGSGLDIVPNPENMSKLQTLPMFGWFASLQYNISKRVFCSTGYSQVRVFTENGYSEPNEYRLSQYCFANVFWNITPSLQTGIEYLYGLRKNMSMEKNHANRIQAMIQYNF